MKKNENKLIAYTKRLTIITLLIVTFAVICNCIFIFNTDDKTFSKIEKAPKNKIELVIEASTFNNENRINLYYKYSLEAAENFIKRAKLNLF
ncbi:hypothetical protein [Lacinutrix jangbogonensis]|uniref:hypothetical protein n=1 Tax=Lacinutrix jangbogonensis TaxID=1469557 RepID=UPI000692424E|nr:hypothetical protein [Lacinutrix jangbogonensis]